VSKQIPIEIKRNYTITTEKDHWILKCDVCGQGFQLKRPERDVHGHRGKEIHPGNLLSLLDHAASHPLPQEEEEAAPLTPPPPSPPRPKLATIRPVGNSNVNHKASTMPAPAERKVELVESAPPSQVSVHKSQAPTVRYPNSYKVEWYGSPDMCHMVKVSTFSDPSFNMYRHVQKMSDHHYSVVVQAANGKHGELIGKRLIHKFFKEQS